MKQKKIVILLLTVIAVLAVITIIINSSGNREKYYFGKVEVDEIDASSKIPGRIDSLYVKLGDKVKKGDTLAVLESKELDAKLGQAKSVMFAAKSKWEMAKRGARIQQKEAAAKLVEQAKYQYDFARSTYDRMKSLAADSVISKQKFDEVEFKYKAAKAQYEAAEAKLNMVNEGARPEEKSAAEALFHQAENVYKEALAYYQELTITAKKSGTVYSLVADQGEIIAAGYPLLTIVDLSSCYVIVNVNETALKYFNVGKQLQGYVPALEKNMKFRVSYIAPMADYASWKPTAQKGEFDVRTFEVRLIPIEKTNELKPGMNVKFMIK